MWASAAAGLNSLCRLADLVDAGRRSGRCLSESQVGAQNSGASEAAALTRFRPSSETRWNAISGRCRPVRLRPVLDRHEGRQARNRQDPERREPPGERRHAHPRLRRVGTLATPVRSISRRSGTAFQEPLPAFGERFFFAQPTECGLSILSAHHFLGDPLREPRSRRILAGIDRNIRTASPYPEAIAPMQV